jgi:small subunit ribosomal protein S16
MDSRAPRDGRTLEEVGFYHPIEVQEKQLKVKEDRVREWMTKGAEPSDTVKRLLNSIQFRV